MDFFDHLADIIIPKMTVFCKRYETMKDDQNYDPIAEFRALMFDISDEETANTMVDGIINGDNMDPKPISTQIEELFLMLLPDYELKKIEFNDNEQHKNFIDYE